MPSAANETGGRRCLFCGFTGTLTREHVIPLWVTEVLNDLESGYPGPDWGLHYTSGGTVEQDRIHPVGDPTVVVRSVCRSCNNGWMAELERAVKTKMSSMIRGHQVALDPAEQVQIGAWASKTAIAFEGFEPSMATTRKEDCRTVAEQQRPPVHHRVRLAHRSEVWESLLVKTLVARSNASTEEIPDAFATMFVIGWLIIQVWGGHGSPFAGVELGIGDVTPSSVMVWPPVSQRVSWPPRSSRAEDELEVSLRSLVSWADDSPSLRSWRDSRRDLGS